LCVLRLEWRRVDFGLDWAKLRRLLNELVIVESLRVVVRHCSRSWRFVITTVLNILLTTSWLLKNEKYCSNDHQEEAEREDSHQVGHSQGHLIIEVHCNVAVFVDMSLALQVLGVDDKCADVGENKRSQTISTNDDAGN